MAVVYEWDVEERSAASTKDFAEDDIIEHWFQTSFKSCLQKAGETPPSGSKYEIFLVRDDDLGRTWAGYDPETKTLDRFADASGDYLFDVPKRFVKEVGAA